jgi:hypothetical protein
LFKRISVIVISIVFLSAAVGLQSAWAQTGGDAELAGKARAKVAKLGVGSNARVEVKLRDGARLKGYVSATDQDSFTLTDSKTGTTTTVAYADVSDVKKAGGGLSSKSWIIIGSAVAGAAITWIAVKPVLCDGGAQTRGPC